MYQLSCSTVNANIKEYVKLVFRKFGDSKSQKLVYSDFEKWIKKHPSILTSFQRNFYYHLWGLTPKDGVNLPGFKLKNPEIFCFVVLYPRKGRVVKVRLEAHSKFLFLFAESDQVLPSSKLR